MVETESSALGRVSQQRRSDRPPVGREKTSRRSRDFFLPGVVVGVFNAGELGLGENGAAADRQNLN